MKKSYYNLQHRKCYDSNQASYIWSITILEKKIFKCKIYDQKTPKKRNLYTPTWIYKCPDNKLKKSGVKLLFYVCNSRR